MKKIFIQTLLEGLILTNIFYWYKIDKNKYVVYLFIAYFISISFFCQYHNIFLLNYIYQTNRYKISLFNIVGTEDISIIF